MKRKEKAHKENNSQSVWFRSWALCSTWSELLYFLIIFSHFISSCPAFCKHHNTASRWRKEALRTQFRCPNRNVFCLVKTSCAFCLFSSCALENVGLLYALCHVLQSLPDVSALCIYLFLKTMKIFGQIWLTSIDMSGGIKTEIKPPKFRCFHRHGESQLLWLSVEI